MRMLRWSPDKITAMILVVGCIFLIGFGIDSEVKSILTMAGVWLFGTSYTDYRRKKEG